MVRIDEISTLKGSRLKLLRIQGFLGGINHKDRTLIYYFGHSPQKMHKIEKKRTWASSTIPVGSDNDLDIKRWRDDIVAHNWPVWRFQSDDKQVEFSRHIFLHWFSVVPFITSSPRKAWKFSNIVKTTLAQVGGTCLASSFLTNPRKTLHFLLFQIYTDWNEFYPYLFNKCPWLSSDKTFMQCCEWFNDKVTFNVIDNLHLANFYAVPCSKRF